MSHGDGLPCRTRVDAGRVTAEGDVAKRPGDFFVSYQPTGRVALPDRDVATGGDLLVDVGRDIAGEQIWIVGMVREPRFPANEVAAA